MSFLQLPASLSRTFVASAHWLDRRSAARLPLLLSEHVGASYRSPGPLSEETKERLRGVVERLVEIIRSGS